MLVADALVNGLIIALFLGVGLLVLVALRTFAVAGPEPIQPGGGRPVSPRREVMWTVLAAVLLLVVFVVAR